MHGDDKSILRKIGLAQYAEIAQTPPMKAMTLNDIEKRARAVGFPAPVQDGADAVITVPIGRDPTPSEFAEWAKGMGGWTSSALWLNARLGTKYTASAVWRWGQSERATKRPVPAKVAALIWGDEEDR